MQPVFNMKMEPMAVAVVLFDISFCMITFFVLVYIFVRRCQRRDELRRMNAARRPLSKATSSPSARSSTTTFDFDTDAARRPLIKVNSTPPPRSSITTFNFESDYETPIHQKNFKCGTQGTLEPLKERTVAKEVLSRKPSQFKQYLDVANI